MGIKSISFVVMLGIARLAYADIAYNLSINTAALVGHPAGPFSLNFQLNDGGSGDANNIATLSNFQFGGGSALGSPSTIGGASGDLSATVVITDTEFLNSFTQQFIAGSVLSFHLGLTTSVDSPGFAPDQFSFAMLDNSGGEIPTSGRAVVGSDVLLLIDIDSENPNVQVFELAPTTAPVPEPSSWLLLGSVTIGLIGRVAARARFRATGEANGSDRAE